MLMYFDNGEDGADRAISLGCPFASAVGLIERQLKVPACGISKIRQRSLLEFCLGRWGTWEIIENLRGE